MTDEELDTLEAKAKAATSGPWEAYRSSVYAASGAQVAFLPEICSSDPACCVTPEQVENNVNFIATANPTAVLELIAELRQARRERDWLASQLEGACYSAEDAEYCSLHDCNDCKYTSAKVWLEAAKEAVK